MKRIVFFVLFLGSLTFLSCDSANEPVKFTDHEYFPLLTGFYQVYDVEETIYELGVPSTLEYQLKTVVADSFQNAAGSVTYVIHRSKRSVGSESWTPDDTWNARMSRNDVVVSEGSTPYVVLKFPLANGVTWNGNAYNNNINPNTNTTEDYYDVESAGTELSVSTFNFPDCVIVEQEDNEEFIVYHDERYEVYARNAGLVSKEVIQLSYCNDEDRNCIGQQIIDKGVIYKQVIVEYGME